MKRRFMETFSEKILSISKTMNAHGPIQWVQDERGEMHYGVQDRMSASSRDEKEEKHVLKYVARGEGKLTGYSIK